MRALVLVPLLLVSCASPEPSRPVPIPAAGTPAPSALPAGAIRFVVEPSRSLATIRVREQVAGVAVPGEAVLTTSAFSGSLVLLPDGSFAVGSVLAVELDSLKSDSTLRDEWIKINTLETRRFPRAELVAERLVGVPLPLPVTGRFRATLESTMRIRGVERDVAWELDIVRDAGAVRGTGAIRFRFGDHGMVVPANRLVLSVVDDIHLAIAVSAREEP